MVVNVQSLLANIHRIELLLQEYNPDMLICTEARITDNIGNNEIHIQGYKIQKSLSSTRSSGGVIVYVREELKVRIIHNWCRQNDNILIFFVDNSSCRGSWIAVYHSPNSNHAEFLDQLSLLYDTYLPTTSNVYVTGDFNIDLKSDTLSRVLREKLNCFQSNNRLRQIVNRYTRVTQTTKTLIDHCYTTDRQMTARVVNDVTVADHKLVMLRKNSVIRNYETRTSFDRTQCTAQRICQGFTSKINVEDLHTHSINPAFDMFYNAVVESVNELINVKLVTVTHSKRWYTAELRHLKTQESIAHNQAHTYNDDASWSQYRITRNQYNRALANAKNKEIQDIITNCQNDRKQLWKELKKLMNDRTYLPDYIRFGNSYLSDRQEIANRLNEYFIESIEEINASIAAVPLNLSMLSPPNNTFQDFTLTNTDQVTALLKTMKSNAGVNNVNRDVILDLLPICAQSIVDLFNRSLQEGVFPDVLKFTIVTPLPKVSGSDRCEDMRPINTACTIDKLLQVIAKLQLQEHVERCEILAPNQSAYRQHHSCETALNLILVDWKEAKEKNKVVVAVFLDFRRAFETVDRDILCKVLDQYGVRGNVLSWFRSWLTSRRQYTRYGERVSSERRNDFGVPQGTPLSCLMFLLYINAIVKVPIHCNCSLFADDTLLWIIADNLIDAIHMINEDLLRISKFLRMMKLKLNVLKTKAMMINARTVAGTEVVVDGNVIEFVESIKYLGVLVDNRLTFASNIEYIMKKIAKKVSLLGRIKKKTNREARLTFFKTAVTPHFDYCSSIFLLANEGQFHQLQVLMNKALRIIENADRYAHIHDMLEATDLLDVKQRVHYNVLMLIYRAQNELLPLYLCKHFRVLSETQPYKLRNNHHLRPPSYTTGASQNSFIYKGALLYNEMVKKTMVDTSVSENIYRKAIKVYVKDNITSHRNI